jgi:hypothetical protein
MALIKPNFDEVQDSVAPGTYKCIIKSGTVKEWPNGGTYVNWEYETYGEDNPKNNGRRIFQKTATSGRGAFTLQQVYMAAVGTSLAGEFDTEQLVGKQVAVEVTDGIDRKTGEPTGYTDVKRVKRLNM